MSRTESEWRAVLSPEQVCRVTDAVSHPEGKRHRNVRYRTVQQTLRLWRIYVRRMWCSFVQKYHEVRQWMWMACIFWRDPRSDWSSWRLLLRNGMWEWCLFRNAQRLHVIIAKAISAMYSMAKSLGRQRTNVIASTRFLLHSKKRNHRV